MPNRPNMPQRKIDRPKPNAIGATGSGSGTYLTEEVHKKFVQSLRAGNYISTICKHLGISRYTYYGWREKGKPSDIYDDDGTVIGTEYPDTIYGEFMRDVDHAIASSEINAVGALTSHFEDDWRAAAEFLSRKFPERWNPKVAVELTGKDGGPVQVEDKRQALYHQLDILHIEQNGESANAEEVGPGTNAKELGAGSEPVDAEIISDDPEHEYEQLHLPL